MDILSQLADKYRTDKGLWHHGYTPIYHSYFEKLRDKPIRLLEIGVGGYHYPDRGGESLRMWRDYFANAEIFGFDFYKKDIVIAGVNILQGSQNSINFLHSLLHPFDIIIDDGSHKCKDIIETFCVLFPLMQSGGIYVVEDTETSYWEEEYGGGTHEHTTMNWFKTLADTLNPASNMQMWFFDKQITDIHSIHFYKGLIFIFKCH